MPVDIKNLLSPESLKRFFQFGLSGASKDSIGLDIGSFSVKAVSIQKDKQQYFITGFSQARIQTDTAKAVKDALSALPTSKKEVSLSLSGHGVILRYVNLPLMSKQELAKSMFFEVEKHIPFPLPEICFDFSILKEYRSAGKMLVLIAAAKKTLVDSRLKLCKEIGYQASSIDVDSLALANYFEKAYEEKNSVCAVINIGANFTLLNIFEDGVLVLSRDINIGGNDFTKAISERANKSMQEAEGMKCSGLNEDLFAAIEITLNNLINGLKVSFDFYECSANRSIDKIFVSGGSCRMAGLPDFLKHSLEHEITCIGVNQNHFKAKPPLDINEFIKEADLFSVALGLAIR